jgi:hypothetical protein
MGSEGGEATSRENLGDFRSGLGAAPGAAPGVRSRTTMPGYREPLGRTQRACGDRRPRDGDEQLYN